MGTFSKVIDTSPHNGTRVRRWLRLGFQEAGLTRDYLFIQGAWRDPLQLALRNARLESAPGQA